MARFILSWKSNTDPDRDIRRIADTPEEAAQGIIDLLSGESVFDAEKSEEGGDDLSYEDCCIDALEGWEKLHGKPLEFISEMRSGQEEELECEEGTFTICRER